MPVAVLAGFAVFAEWRALPVMSRAAMYGLLGVCALTLIAITPDRAKSILALLQTILLLLFFLAFRFLARLRGHAFIRDVWLAVGVGILLYQVLWAVTLAIRWPPKEEWLVAAVPGVANVRSIGYFSLAAFCSGISVATSKNDWKNVALAGLLLAIAAWGTALWTGSRGAVFAIMIATAVTLFLAKDMRVRTAFVVVLSLLIAIAMVYPLPYGSDNYGLQNFFIKNQGGSADQFSSGRIAIWKDLFDRALLHPWFGLGLDQFQQPSELLPKGVKQPHSWPLQIFFSTGVAGLILVPMALAPLVPWKKAVLLDRRNLPSIACLAGLLAYSGYDAAGYYLYPLTLAAIALASLQDYSQPASDMSG